MGYLGFEVLRERWLRRLRFREFGWLVKSFGVGFLMGLGEEEGG